MPRESTSWLRLLRVPNLFTVPGDPLAGAMLAAATAGTEFLTAGRVATAVAVSLLLYMGGLIDNDLADLKEDRRDRPSRPLPSGQIRISHAVAACVLMLGGGVALSAANGLWSLIVAGAIMIVILLYNHLLKRIAVVGPVAMGLCRGLSVLIGAAALWDAGVLAIPALLAAVLIALYIAAVTAIAAGETSGKPVGRRRNLPAMLLAFFFTFVFITVFQAAPDWRAWLFLALALVSVVGAGVGAIRLGGEPSPAQVQKTIGLFIRVLLAIQAAFCCLGPWPGLIVAAGLIAIWPVAAAVGRKFYAS